MPENVLVVDVNVCKMTSPVRVYMLALAVADLMVCVSGNLLAAGTLVTVGCDVFSDISRMSQVSGGFPKQPKPWANAGVILL